MTFPRLAWLGTACACLWLLSPLTGSAADGLRSLGLQPAAADDDLDEAHYRSIAVVRPGSSAAASRRAAIEALPLKDFTPDAREKAQRVLDGLGLFRRLPTLSFEVDPEVYQYLLKHPTTAVSTWRAMEISRLKLEPTGLGTFAADAGDGSTGQIELWKSTPTETVIYCDGAFKSPMLTKPVIARSIMRLQARFYQDEQGRQRVEHTGDVFVEFPSATIETVARVIAPLSYSIADKNFRQLSLYVQLMSQAMSRHPEWVRAIAQRMDVAEPERAAFIRLAEQTSDKQVPIPPAAIPVDEVLAPLRRSLSTTEPTVPARTASIPRPVVDR